MFSFSRKKTAEKAANGERIAATHTELPLDQHMTLLMAQEIPIMDSVDRARVYEILRAYEGPTITSQEELPEEIRRIMDL